MIIGSQPPGYTPWIPSTELPTKYVLIEIEEQSETCSGKEYWFLKRFCIVRERTVVRWSLVVSSSLFLRRRLGA